MQEDVNTDRNDQLPALPAASGSSIEQLVDRVFDADVPLAFIQRQLDAAALSPEQRHSLQSLGSFFLGWNAVQQLDYGAAQAYFAVAAEGLSDILFDQLRDLAVGLHLYSEGVVALQERNVGLALDRLAQTQDHLRKAGKYGQRYQIVIDLIQPEVLLLQALDALLGLDIDRARLLIEQVSQAAAKCATLYCERDTPDEFFWKAYAHYAKAFYAFSRVQRDFVDFNFDNLARETDLDRDAVQARDLFSKAVTANPNVRILININNGILEHLHVIVDLTSIMVRVFDGTFRADPRSFDSMRRGARKAAGSYSQVGALGVTLLRFCDQLLDRINNLERLTRPKLASGSARPPRSRPKQQPAQQ